MKQARAYAYSSRLLGARSKAAVDRGLGKLKLWNEDTKDRRKWRQHIIEAMAGRSSPSSAQKCVANMNVAQRSALASHDSSRTPFYRGGGDGARVATSVDKAMAMRCGDVRGERQHAPNAL